MVSEYDVRSQKQHILLVARWMDEHAPDVIIGQELLDATRKMQKAAELTIKLLCGQHRMMVDLDGRFQPVFDHTLRIKL